jgi:hypothetical protein
MLAIDGDFFWLPIGETFESKPNGMTLRDYFAAKALEGMAAGDYWSENFREQDQAMVSAVARAAYAAADAMLAERDK